MDLKTYAEDLQKQINIQNFTAVCDIHGETEFRKIMDYEPHCLQCWKIAREEEDKQRRRQQYEDWFFGAMEGSGIDKNFPGFDGWQFDKSQQQRQEKLISNLMGYANNFTVNNPNILFIGGTGSGKTMLTTAIARIVFKQFYKPSGGAVCELIKSSRITSLAKASWTDKTAKTESTILAELAKLKLLVIDDLGDGDTSGSPEMVAADRLRFGQLIDMRYHKYPTIITTNLNLEQVKVFLGDRAWDRFQEKLIIVNCNWQSHRKAIAQVGEW